MTRSNGADSMSVVEVERNRPLWVDYGCDLIEIHGKAV
jgi:hypothetical protein